MNIMNKVTWKGLLKNKTRTIVTIIGVILSTSMITAVTTFISSLQNYIINYTIEEEGDWHGAVYDIDLETYQSLSTDTKLQDVVKIRPRGYANLEGGENAFKPYLRVLELEEAAFDILPICLESGRFPENENEVLVSEHVDSNGGVKYQVGDTLTLDLGVRVAGDGILLGENDSLLVGENEERLESLSIQEEMNYTVVGTIKRLSYEFEKFSSPGYTIVTKMNEDNLFDSNYSAYFKVDKPSKIYSVMNQVTREYKINDYQVNNELLRYMGISNDNSFNQVLFGLGSILIALIMVGSISLIYNSFAISVSERVKQFGLLSTVGATPKQRKNSVYFESLVIAGFGIPIGIIAGIAGIGITLYLLRGQMTSILPKDYISQLDLSVSISSIVVAILVALVTILLSAFIPAKKCKKISAIDAIRQTNDIKLSSKRVRNSKMIRKLFGMEGDIALKNLKRNRRRYRATVISLFVSVVLFISASGFGMYLRDSVTNVYENTAYDLSYIQYSRDNQTKTIEDRDVFRDILTIDGIEQGSVVKEFYEATKLPKEQINEEHYARMVEYGRVGEGEDLIVTLQFYAVDHDTYQDYVQGLGSKAEQLDRTDEAVGIVIDRQHYYDPTEGRYRNLKILKDTSLASITLHDWEEKPEETPNVELTIGAFAETAPFGVMDYAYDAIIVIVDEIVLEEEFATIQDRMNSIGMYFSAKDPIVAEEKVKEILSTYGMDSNRLYNLARELQNDRNIITIISVFAYGFITLISLITIANVFNTISTNVNLRRREFAMLKSVGMTKKSFNKMLNMECIFYGLKALLYGIPVSIGVTYLIYHSVENGVDMDFYLPVEGMIISVFSVFFVVFVSMMYSMGKIKNENILDGLRNENL